MTLKAWVKTHEHESLLKNQWSVFKKEFVQMLQPRDTGKRVEGHTKSTPPVARVQLHIFLKQPQNGPCGYHEKETTISCLTTQDAAEQIEEHRKSKGSILKFSI